MTNRVLILSGIYPPDTGGPAKFVESFGNWCVSAGDEITILSYTNGGDFEIRFGNPKIYLLSRQTNLVMRYFGFIRTLYLLHKKVDAIIINGCFIEVSLARLLFHFSYTAKVPGDIVWERARNLGYTKLDIDSFQSTKTKFRLRVMRYLFSRSLRQAQHVITPSTHLMKLAKSWGVSEKQLNLVFNSIDVNKFSPGQKIKPEFDVLTVCRLVPWKGIDQVIQSCAALNLKLCIVGNGPELSNLKKIASDLSARVTFLGETSQEYLPEIYLRAKFFVLNSSFEATSYALLEARASGLVCIANANTGSEEVISHKKDGFVCNGEDQMELLHALKIVTASNFDYGSFSGLSVSDTKLRFNIETNFREIRNQVLEK